MLSCAVGREEHCEETSLACMGSAHSVWATLGAPIHGHTFLVYNAQAPGCSAGELSNAGPGLSVLPRFKPLRFSSKVSTKAQTSLGRCFVLFPGPSSSGDKVFGKRGHCELSPPPSLPLSFLGVQPAHLLRRMLTVQNPTKS